MNDSESIKNTIRFFVTEFAMVFLGVLVAFWVNDWGEKRRNKEITHKIIENISEDVRADSINIVLAITMITRQYNEVNALSNHLSKGKYDSASLTFKSCYSSITAFKPTTESYQSMIYGGDLKLIENYKIIRILKDIDQINQQVDKTHDLYFEAINDMRNSFVCKEDIDNLNLKGFSNRREFWNRLQFLRATYLKNYMNVLQQAQTKYHKYLNEYKNIDI